MSRCMEEFDCNSDFSFLRVSNELVKIMDDSEKEQRKAARKKHRCCSCGILFMQQVVLGEDSTFIVTLLEEESYNGFECNTPGGKVEVYDKNREIVAIRETYEELGVLVKEEDLSGCPVATTYFKDSSFIKHLDYVMITCKPVISKNEFNAKMKIRREICPFISSDLTEESKKEKRIVTVDFKTLYNGAILGWNFYDLSGVEHKMGNRLREILLGNNWEDLLKPRWK